MSRKPKSKISTDHQDSLTIANPFAEVNLNNLPKSPPTASNSVIETKLKGRVDIIREKSGRAGKTVTVLRGFADVISTEELASLMFQLKKLCACGGSLKERTIELQGDVCEPVMRELEKLKFRPVRCGG